MQTSPGSSPGQALQGIAEKAKSHETYRFRHRYGMLNEERLKDCWRDIRTDAAYGVDEMLIWLRRFIHCVHRKVM